MAKKKKIILRNYLSPGDIVMLTAAVRDLHIHYPGKFITDVRTSCPALWEENPYLQNLSEEASDVEIIDCHYPLIDDSNQIPKHFIYGFIEHLNERLDLQISPTVFHGDIHISDKEKRWWSQVQEITGEDTPFWIIAAGGKFDFTIKWWDQKRYQKVVDDLQGRVVFVQVGESHHHHPALKGVIDLRGKTDLRQLVRLIYNSQGVLCPVTSLMHLAAAVECKRGIVERRPCVVIAGGRESSHWEAYPNHQFVHTIGALPCCMFGGCWKARTMKLNDGHENDADNRLCVNRKGDLPMCMNMITSAEIVRRVELYFEGGAARFLSKREFSLVRKHLSK